MLMLDATTLLQAMPFTQMVDELAQLHCEPIGLIDELLMESSDTGGNTSHFFIRSGWQPEKAAGAKVITVFPRNYQYDLGRSLFGLKDLPIYIGTSIEAGNVWGAQDSFEADDLIAASSLYIATDSKLGPVALAVGYTEDDESAIYFYLGKEI